MAWPLVLVGIAMGISLILIKVRSPMLFAVGMYLPLETTVGDLRRRPHPRRGGQDARQARLQRGAEGAGRERGGAGGVGADCRRSADRPVHRGRRRHPRPANQFWSVSRGCDNSRRPWMAIPVLAFLVWYLICRPAAEGRRRRRARAADGGHVGSGLRASGSAGSGSRLKGAGGESLLAGPLRPLLVPRPSSLVPTE